MPTRAEAAAARAQQVRQPADRPSQRRCAVEPDAGRFARGGAPRVERATTSGGALATLTGYASTTEQPYEMYDYYGPYTEVVSRGAFGATLARTPDVQLNYQHGRLGTPIARTTITDGEGSLLLSEDDTGLAVLAVPGTGLSTTTEVLRLIELGILDEMSFAFTITRGVWSPDYTEYRIAEVDIDRGDVSVVNYGANPATSVEVARSADDLAATRARAAARQRAVRVASLSRS